MAYGICMIDLGSDIMDWFRLCKASDVLITVWNANGEGITGYDVYRKLGISSNYCYEMIRILKKESLISMVISGRRHVLYITSNGEVVAKKLYALKST